MYDNIDKIYGVPIKEIACPYCGRKYGHHKTKVDTISEECSSCVKEAGYKEVNFISAKEFIENIIGYKPFCF